jgi:hypothetical protein
VVNKVKGLFAGLRAAGKGILRGVFEGIGQSIGQGIGGLFGQVRGFLGEIPGRAADVDLLAKKFGTTTQEVSALAYAFEQQGVSFDAFQGTLEGLATTLSHNADAASDTFIRLGLNARELIRLPLPESLDKVVDALNRVGLEEDRLRFANELGLGSLMPILRKGSAGLRELKAEAAAAGAVLTADQAERGREVMLQYTKTWQSLKYAVLEAGTALLPSKERIQEVGQVVRGLIDGLRRMFGDLRERVSGFLTSLTEAGGTFHQVAETIGETWRGVVDAVRRGDLEAAFKTLAAGTKAVWFEMLIAMSNAFREWINAHRGELVRLGVILGAVKGAQVGGLFGPWGLLAGAGAGGLGGGLLAGEVADTIAGLGNNPQLKAAAERARRDLAAGVAARRAAAGGGDVPPGGVEGGSLMEFVARAFRENHSISLSIPGGEKAGQVAADVITRGIKGTFALPAAQQQLAYGDTAQRNVINGIQKIGKDAEALPQIQKGIEELNKNLRLK